MTHDELIAYIDDSTNGLKYDDIFPLLIANTQALRAVVDLCVAQDEVTIGDKGLFNSGRNSMREEITQAIEKELR